MKQGLYKRTSVYGKLLSFVLFLLLINGPAHAQQIITDGNTSTNLNVNGTITDVTTTTVKNSNAFNSFSKFNVDAGNTVNLVVPGGADRLINIVKNEATNINGILNSVEGGVAGRGNIYLVNPHGIVVGATGQINVGALTAITPTQAYVDTFFDSPGNPNDAAVISLLNGTAPINTSAAITNAGTITGQTRIETSSGSFTNSGTIQLSDIVNVDKVVDGTVVGQYNGDIVITTAGDITNTGAIKADGANNLDGGNISLTATGNVNLNDGTLVSAKGVGANSNGGQITIQGNSVNFNSASTIDASGGDISGNGGIINLTGATTIIPEGKYKASATNGTPGTINIHSDNDLTINTNQYSDGANLNFSADNNLTIYPSVTISTRDLTDVYTEDHTTALSQGNSGNLSFNASNKFELFSSSIHDQRNLIYSFADNVYDGSNISFISKDIILRSRNIIKTDKNITINPTNSLQVYIAPYLDENNINILNDGTNIIAGEQLTLNGGDISNNGIYFKPNSINTGILVSDFLINNSSLIINSNNLIRLANFDNIIINNSPININNFTINSSIMAEYTGSLNITGNLTMISPSVRITGKINSIGSTIYNVEVDDETIRANNITLDASNFLNLQLINIYSNGTLTLNSGDILNYGVSFSPKNLEAESLQSNFLVQNGPLNIYSNSPHGCDINIGNLDKISIGGQPLNVTSININNSIDAYFPNKNVALTGDITINGDVNIQSGNIFTGDLNLTANNITFNASSSFQLYGGNINTPGLLVLNAGNFSDYGALALAAKSIRDR